MVRMLNDLKVVLSFALFLLAFPANAETIAAKSVKGDAALFDALPAALMDGTLSGDIRFEFKSKACSMRAVRLSVNGIRPRWLPGGWMSISRLEKGKSQTWSWTVDLSRLRFEYGKSFHRKAREIQGRKRDVRFEVRGCGTLKDAEITLKPAPQTGLVAWTETPDRTLSTRLVEFFFQGKSGLSLDCRLDGANYIPCINTARYFPVGNGWHNFDVRASNAQGVQGYLSHSFYVYRGPFDAEILKATPVESPTPSDSIEFELGQTRRILQTQLQCRLDGAEFKNCSSPIRYQGLASGDHRFEVRQLTRVLLWWVASDPDAYTWTVLRQPPVVEWVSTPAVLSNSNSAAFAFQATGASAFSCALDGAAASDCSSPWTLEGLEDGIHHVVVQARDAWGQVSAPLEHAWQVDTLAPVTTLTRVVPQSDPSNSTQAQFTLSASEDSRFVCALDGQVMDSCASPVVFTVAEGAHQFEVTATDLAGNVGQPASAHWFVDLTVPTLTLIPRLPANLPDRTGHWEVEVAASEEVALACELDGVDLGTCGNVISGDVGEGEHLLHVSAIDDAGNLSEPVEFRWLVDMTAPVLSAVFTPAGALTESTSLSAEFEANEPATYTCELDGAGAAACTSPYAVNQLAEGNHSLVIYAQDAAGNRSGALEHSWQVVGTALVTLDARTPSAALTNQTSVSFEFSSDSAASFECALDGAAFAACASPANYTGLADGTHQFQVRGLNILGNPGPAVSSQWEVDATAPTVIIGAATPAEATTASKSMSLAFSAAGASSFSCRLDNGVESACTSPVQWSALADGTHTAQIRAVDAAGNVSPYAVYSWTVKTIPPTVVIGAANPPEATTALTSMSLAFSAAGASSFYCRLDNGAEAACTSPVQWSALADGTHTAQIRAVDAAGNSSAYATYSWTVKTIKLEFVSISLTQITRTSALMRWTTNFPATGRVQYGVGGNLNLSTDYVTPAATTQSILIQNLTPNTQYRARVNAVTPDGLTANSTTVLFNTLR
ncbi:hypothetical protein K2X33_07985 [bacterium]|nr:hypothetical protein [bacterium]